MKSAYRFTPRAPKREKTTLSSCSESSEKTREPVGVYCRLRPLSEEKEESCIKLISPTVISLISPADAKILRKDVNYVFKHVFTSYASQKEVFDHVALPMVQDVLKGKNGLLFTYGVTGSGKTYTLCGDMNNPGILPRSIDMIFNTIGEFQAPKFVIKSDKMNGFEVQTENDALKDRLIEVKSSKNVRGLMKKTPSETQLYYNDGAKVTGVNETSLYAVFVTYVEIYNNTVFDLLDESGGKVLQGKILREDAYKNMYVNGAVEVEVKSAREAFDLFHLGQKRKRMAHTILNSESSRSHSIFNIRIVQLEQFARNGQGEPMIPDRNLLIVGQLSLVDLAGSERCSRTHNTGLRLKEASSINNSLMSLRNCLEILRENQITGGNRLVPYRDSRLTLLFKNYFEGDGKVKMIVCVNPSVNDYEETLQVMKFAEMTQEVKVIKPEVCYTPYKKIQKTPKSIKNSARKGAGLYTPSTPMVFGPRIPSFKLNLEDLDETSLVMEKLLKILRTRRDKGRIFDRDVENKIQSFRQRLSAVNHNTVINKSELKSLKVIVKKEKQKSQNLETKILDLETVNESLQAKNEELCEVIRSLQCTIDEKDLKINQNYLEKEKTKHKMAMHAEKMNQELDMKLRKQREHLHAAMLERDNKLRKVREVLESELVEIPKEISHQPITKETQTIGETESVEKLRPGHRKLATTPSMRHRRSRSVGEVWLEHNSVKPVPLGTVMQPAMKKRKSVTKLSKASDVTNPKQNKYCLIAQEAATDGEMETKLYKADIVPTCGGGAQVIFNDVERLRQESPTGSPRK